MNGYLADFNFIDGQQLDPTSFGETKSGVWIPKDTSGLTFGTNGFRLEFGDSSAIGDDTSGNGNDYTANNLSAHDVVPDSPTNNYATLSSVWQRAGSSATLSEGNLKAVCTGNYSRGSVSTLSMTSGKWYAEFDVGASGSNRQAIGVTNMDTMTGDSPLSGGTDSVIAYGDVLDDVLVDAVDVGDINYGNGDIVGIAVNMDDDEVTFYKNGAFSITVSKTFTAGGNYGFLVAQAGSSSTGTFTCNLNFGQDSTFAGATTAGGNSDENGYGDFKYAVPSGFLALNSANLPEPAISPLNDDVPEDYFNTVLYTGNGSTQSITGVGFQPDWTWVKSRNVGGNHILQDAVRGVGKGLFSDLTNVENASMGGMTSFDSDGFSLDGSVGELNANTRTFAAWNWKAGTSFSNSAGANGADIASTGSVSTKSGFSIVEYTGSNSANDVVYHGIGTAPSLIIIKNRDVGTSSGAWGIFTDRVEAERLQFDANADFNNYPIQSFDANTFQLPTLNNTAWSVANDYIAYCFASIEGYSKIGIYVGGSSSTDNTFVYTGFRPAWVMVKQTNGTGHWHMYDNKRGSSNEADPTVTNNNVVNKLLYGSLNNAEVTFTTMDFVSNGFKFRTNQADISGSGQTYLFMAFAEMPQKYANAK